ncbi:MAG: thioglycine synthase [Actinomycetota bacterium]|jgi:putative methanogenesis marker protein 1|nr:thioglycine synthase [Actinomycetota bacterium]MDQ1497156.1 thioglycine synthase [Actinomycetota bacterium]
MSGYGQNLAEPPPRPEFLGRPEETAKAVRAGTHRVRSLEATEVTAMTAARAAGMTRLAELTGLDRLGIPVFSSMRPAAEAGSLTVTGGKGASTRAARLSALLEAVERHCGERQGRTGVVATRQELQTRVTTLDPAALILSAGHGYRDDVLLEWWPTRDVDRDEVVMIPAVAVLCPYRLGPFLFRWSSNGLAAGNSLPEAFLHGLLEVIERDATSFGETVLDGPLLDTASLAPGEASDLVARFAAAGIDTWVRVFTTEVGIPTFHVVLDDRERRDPLLINGGFGCHLDPAVGLTRALTEAALSRASVIAGAREDLADMAVKRDLGYDRLKEGFARWFRADRPRVPLADHRDLSTDSIAGDLDVLLSRLRGARFNRVLAADLSLPGLGFCVTRAVVPGMELRHIDRGRMGPRLARRVDAAA